MLDDLPILEPTDRRASDFNRLARGRNPVPLSQLRSAQGLLLHHRIPLGDLLIDREVGIREARPKPRHQFGESFHSLERRQLARVLAVTCPDQLTGG